MLLLQMAPGAARTGGRYFAFKEEISTMKRRLLSLLLAFVTMCNLLPTVSFAADSVEAALGEVNIYNGEYELGYLSINGAVKKQVYTYFLYEANDGTMKESPAYCVNPTTPGVPQTVGPGESIKYLADEKASDPKVVGILSLIHI